MKKIAYGLARAMMFSVMPAGQAVIVNVEGLTNASLTRDTGVDIALNAWVYEESFVVDTYLHSI